MKCFACNYDDEREAQKFLYIDIVTPDGQLLEEVVFQKINGRPNKSLLYACPECGAVKIDPGD